MNNALTRIGFALQLVLLVYGKGTKKRVIVAFEKMLRLTDKEPKRCEAENKARWRNVKSPHQIEGERSHE